MNHALDFVLPADQRVDFAVFCELVKVLRELFKRRSFLVLLDGLFVFSRALTCFQRLRRVTLFDAVRDEIHHVQTGHALLVQVVNSVRILFAKNGDQNVCAGNFLLAIPGRLHMHDGALNDTLETKRRLGINIVTSGHLRCVVLDEIGKRLPQVIDIGGTRTQHFGRTWVVKQCKQQVFNSDELVALLAGLDKGHVQADF